MGLSSIISSLCNDIRNFQYLGDQTNACDVLEDQQLLESPSHLPTVAENHSSKKFISSLQPFKLSTRITRYAPRDKIFSLNL